MQTMKYEMNLHNGPFGLIKSGFKTVEMRLNDERRQNIKSGDVIVFTNRDSKETLEVMVLKTEAFSSFDELYKHYDKNAIGYKDDEIANPNDMLLYYSKELITKYGVLAISIKLI